jgi:hypothetical protein
MQIAEHHRAHVRAQRFTANRAGLVGDRRLQQRAAGSDDQ